MAEARTTMCDGDDGEARRDGLGYQIDPHAVAEAIVSRLLAGRALRAPRDARRDA